MPFHFPEVVTIVLITAVYIKAIPPVVINENAAVGTQLGSVKLCGGQSHLNLIDNYTAPWKFFRVNSTHSGSSLVLKKTLDLKEPTGSNTCWPMEAWQKTGRFKCGNDNKEESLTVIVTATNNFHPTQFCNQGCNTISTKVINVTEDTAVNAVLTTVQLCDQDVLQLANAKPITKYSSDAVVTLTQTNHQVNVLLKKKLDYEVKPKYTVTLTVSDGTHGNYSLAMTINVVDVDDLPPTFNKKLYRCSLPEGEYKSTKQTNCRVTAKDRDKGINAPLSYSVINTDTGNAKFTVDGKGVIQIQGTLDRENQSTIVIPVKAFQIDRPDDRIDIVPVVLTVTDVDDNPPTFTPNSSQISIIENTPTDTLVFQFTVTDPDEGPNAEVTYKLISGSEAFQIDNDGKLTVKDSTKLDREKIPSINVKVVAIPKHSTSGFHPNASLVIHLLDENDNTPKFDQTTYAMTINKTKKIGTEITQVSASDPDSGVNGDVVYTIIDSDHSLPFKINKNTGSIQLNASISDYRQPSYSFGIRAEDQATDVKQRRVGLATVVVKVLDVNVNTPDIVLLESHNISEAAQIGSPVALLQITDKDITDNLTVTVGGSKGNFSIKKEDQAVYRLVTTSTLDRETHESYSLIVYCFDGKHNESKAVSVTILDENDNAPVFSKTFNFQVSENKDQANVGRVIAVDRDKEKNGEIVYRLDENSQWYGNFTMDAQSGTIKTRTFLDREALGDPSKLVLPVFAVDKGDNPQSGTGSVTITVLDVNDNPPIFEETNVTYTMKELEPPRVIHTAKATDRDLPPNDKLKYRVIVRPSSLSTMFTTSETNGTVKMNKPIHIDKTDHGYIHLQIYAFNVNNRSLKANQIVILHVKDVNNFQPEFQNKSYSFNIMETMEPETLVGRVQATDHDSTPLYSTVTYWLEGSHRDFFRIDAQTGELFLITTIDLDKQGTGPQYSLKVLASDMQPSWNSSTVSNISTSMTVHVASVNEYTPVFEQDNYICSLEENHQGTFGCTVKAIDNDSGSDGTITYTLLNSTKNFRMNESSGEVSVISHLDYDGKNQPKLFHIDILASDKGNPQKSAVTSATIHLQNVNDIPPHISWGDSRRLYVAETVTLARGTLIGKIPILDDDRNDGKPLNVSLADDFNGLFLTKSDGGIYLKKAYTFNFEEKATYTLDMVVKDDVHQPVSKSIILDVINVNEYAPTIVASNFTIQENENKSYHLQANDSDAGIFGDFSFKVVDPSVKNKVSLTADGTLTVLNLDKEKLGPIGLFLVPVIAVDKGTPPLTGLANIKIKVTGINDNDPYYLDRQKQVHLTVDEGKTYPSIFTSMAYDDDIGEGSDIHYRLDTGGDNSLFTVNSNTGAVSIIHRLQPNQLYQLQVQAYNSGIPHRAAFQHLNITVKDVNNHAPVFKTRHYFKSISECTETGANITRVEAVDGDLEPQFKTVTYWIEMDVPFTVHQRTGDIFLSRPIDYDPPSNNHTFTFNVYATDVLDLIKTGSNTSHTTVTITITNCNDNKPHFTQDNYICSLEENHQGTFGCTVKAIDNDSGSDGTITYSILNFTKNFRMNESSGEVSVISNLDYDDRNQPKVFHIVILASDKGKPPKSAITSATIHLQNVNDIPPHISWSSSRRLYVTETVPIAKGTLLGKIPILDSDGNDGKPLNVSLANDLNGLLITKPDGGIYLKIAYTFNFEEKSTYTLDMVVKDDVHQPVSKSIILDVINVNEYAPTIVASNFTIQENENKSFHLQANDSDAGIFGDFSFKVVDPSVKDKVSLTADGNLTVLNLDREKLGPIGLFLVPVIAVDKGTPPLTGMANIKIKVTGINDNDPYYLDRQKQVHLTVNEGKTYPSIFTSMAYDDDIGEGSDIHYRLDTGGDNSLFTVNSNTGAVSIIHRLQPNQLYQLQVQAYNSGIPHRAAFQHLNITVKDVNNHTPVFKTLQYINTISECTETGANITSVEAVDGDLEPQFKTVTYWIEQDVPFTVHPRTGDIVLSRPIDYDPPANNHKFIFNVYATDVLDLIKKGPHTNHTTVTITITNCNDNKPHFSQDVYTCQLKEKSVQTTGCNILATDMDNNTLKYNITGDPQFLRLESGSGEIRTHSIDYDNPRTVKHYTLTVSVTDGKFTSNASVLVDLVNINDNSPVFKQPSYNFSIPENDVSPMFGVISATDKDGDKLTYSMRGDCTGITMSADGVLSQTQKFDYEQTQSCTCTATVSDSKNVANATLLINVRDENDNQPSFTNAPYTQFVDETVNVHTSIIKIHASDGDRSSPNNKVTYTLVSGNTGGAFSINNQSGVIYTAQTLDASKHSQYSLTVQAKDGGKPALINVAGVTIHVKDINNHQPKFLYTPYHVDVTENQQPHQILQVFAEDADPSANLSFSIGNTPFQKYFFINKTMLYVKTLDLETLNKPSISIPIEVTDGQNTDKTSVSVTVHDVNDHTPHFDDTPNKIQLNDTIQVGSIILHIQAKDGDFSLENSDLRFFLYHGEGYFDINITTGKIILLRPLYKRDFSLSIFVTDSGSPPKSNQTDIKVEVIVTNKFAPHFLYKATSGNKYDIRFKEGASDQIANFSAVDGDSGKAGHVSYTIHSNDDWQHLFNFNNKTAILKMTQPVNYEDTDLHKYTFIVTAMDNGQFKRSSEAVVIVHIEDVDEPPTLHLPTPTVYKERMASAGSIISRVTVTDPDKAVKYRNFTFSVIDGDLDLEIENSGSHDDEGIIKTKAVLSQPGTYKINITVTDGGRLHDTKTLTVDVSNVKGSDLNVTILENTQPPVELDNIYNATGANKTIVFTMINSSTSDNFKIFPNGSFMAMKSLDREETPAFYVELKGYERLNDKEILKAQVQMHVTVLDVNDNAPQFNRSVYNTEVKESHSKHTAITTVTATDVDIDPKLEYSLSASDGTFKINAQTGVITLQNTLNYDTHRSYNLTVECTDGKFSNRTTVMIKILDINNHNPTFVHNMFNLTLNESQHLGPLGFIVTATDPDTADQGKLKYTILPIGSPLSIDSQGQLSLQQKLDFDTKPPGNDISMTIQAKDTANHTGSTTLKLSVKDTNDNPPIFRRTSYTFHVPEGIKVLTSNFSVEATDLDSGENRQITFSINGTNRQFFNIITKQNKGFIQIVQPLDRESESVGHDNTSAAIYTLTVIATDHGHPPLTSSVHVQFYVEDVNDCGPVFSSSNYSESVQEGTALGTKIGSISTTDCDSLQQHKTVTYSITGTASDVFNITSTGDIILAKKVSIKQQIFNLEITATDGKNTAKAGLTVRVLDANDNSPNFTQQQYSFSVSENLKQVTVGMVTAVDDDPGDNGNVSYMITSGNVNNTFSILKTTNGSGLIRTEVSLDREHIDTYSLIITAEDHAKTGRRQGTCTVLVAVTDINDNYPVFDGHGYTGMVQEDAKSHTVINVIPPIHAVDQDNGIYGTEGIQYSLRPNNSGFCIDNNTSVVSVCQPLNRENKEQYVLHVVATDDVGSGLSANISLTINVEDINDEAPNFINTSYRFSIPENAPPKTAVGQVTVTDEDKDGLQKVRLTILTGGHENFYIEDNLHGDKLIGTIYVIGTLDREEMEAYTLMIEASDTVQTSNTTVNIEILDENDNNPVFNETRMDVAIMEGSAASIIYTIAAYDKDKPGTINSTVVFHLDNQTVAEYGDRFAIYTNGSLYTKKPLDRENQSSYKLIVVASDQGKQPCSTSMPVLVTVLDVNDNAPKFCPNGSCKIHSYVVETAPVNSIIALPVATDPDEGNNGSLVYSIIQSPAAQYFNIKLNTGLVTIAKPIVINTLLVKNIVSSMNASTKDVTVNISIEARDKGPDGGLYSTLTLLVTVEPINDNAPVFPSPCNFSVTEEQSPGTGVGDCVAVIPNVTFSHLTYRLIAGFDTDTFDIDSQNGRISTKTILDHETTSHYSLSVQVTDGRTPERTAFSAVTITVQDINDNSPEFYQSPISVPIPENTAWTNSINASAFDRDSGPNGALSYTIDNDYNGTFVLNKSSGLLTINGTFDREQTSTITLHVQAMDHGVPSKSASVEIVITVQDMNDHAPVFHNVLNTYSIPENKSGQVFTISATDVDAEDNGTVTYSLVNSDGGPFRVDTKEGTVFVDGRLDYETRKLYHLQFVASDHGQPPRQTHLNITVNVTDVYDFVPKFKKSTYEVYINATCPLDTIISNHSVVEGMAQYSLSGSDSGFFHIDPTTSVVTLKSILGVHNRQYVATVTAVDQLNQTAEYVLIVHIIGHEVFFDNTTFTASLLENLNDSQLLLDLNTTEERKGLNVVYSIQKIDPPVLGVFHIEPKTGKLYCDAALDREAVEEYNIYISAYLSPTQHRQRRAIDDSAAIVKLTVHVTDVDDNPPHFPTTQQKLFGIPSDAGEGYLVTQIMAVDPDLGDNGQVFYEATGDTEVFGVDRNSGAIKTLLPISGRREKTYHLNITAMDKDKLQEESINIQVIVVSRSDRLMMIVNKPLSEFQKDQDNLIRNISDILGVEIQLEKAESHRYQDGDVTQLDLTKSDMYFHGINTTSGAIVPYSQMMTLINKAQEDLEKLLNSKTYEVIHVKKQYSDPSAISVPVICLIIIALLIFLGSTIGIIVTLISWSRLNRDMEALKKQKESQMALQQQTYEMDTLRSHTTQEPGVTRAAIAEAVNPMYMETELVRKPKKKRVEYEAKEMCMNFGNEPLRFTDELLTGTRSIADSALENTSLNSDANRAGSAGSSGTSQPAPHPGEPDIRLTVDEGPVMTSSPRISMDIDADRRGPMIGTEDQDSRTGLKKRNSKVLTFMMDSGETETDAEALDDNDEYPDNVEKKHAPLYNNQQTENDDTRENIDDLYSKVQKPKLLGSGASEMKDGDSSSENEVTSF